MNGMAQAVRAAGMAVLVASAWGQALVAAAAAPGGSVPAARDSRSASETRPWPAEALPTLSPTVSLRIALPPLAALCAPTGQTEPVPFRDDIYDRVYDDDTSGTLNFVSSDGAMQIHNFWLPDDEDWAAFNADVNRWYSINVTEQAANCDAMIYLCHEADLQNPLVARDDWGPGGPDELISWYSGPISGTLFAKVTQSPLSPGLSGEATTYTLTVTGDWGQSAGLATISGTQRAWISRDGGTLEAGPGGIYTKHKLSVPAGALSIEGNAIPAQAWAGQDASVSDEAGEEGKWLILDAPDDISNDPWYEYTKKWLNERPHNASIVWITPDPPESFSFSVPAVLSVQFVNDGGYYPELDFLHDDLPPGFTPADMRIYAWTGADWTIVPGPQTVEGDVVSVPITSLGTGYFAVAPGYTRLEDWRDY